MNNGTFRNQKYEQETSAGMGTDRYLGVFSLPVEELGEVKMDMAILAAVASQLVAMDKITYLLTYGDTNGYEELSTIKAIQRALGIYREVLSAMKERQEEDGYPLPERETSFV